jgi:hypothetical protein
LGGAVSALTHPLAPLLAARQWIPVRLVPLPNGKTDKLPLDYRTGQVTAKGSDGAHDSAIWLSHETALWTAQSLGPSNTVGFVITESDPFWCLDIDGALQADGTWSPLALELCAALPGTAVEVSQSGTGLHIWGQGHVPDHLAKNVPLHIELYSRLRFIAIGTNAVGDMSQPCASIAAVAARYFPPRATYETPDDGPRADWRGPTDDDDLIRRAMQSRSAASVFGGGKAAFADLWTADAAALAKAYPPDSNSSEPYDRSSADAALAAHLSFWTGCDVARIERLMRRSALVRQKWDDRDDYLVERTITNACRMQRDVLRDKPPPEPPLGAMPGPAAPPADPQPGVVITLDSPAFAAPSAPAATTASMTRRPEQSFLGPQEQQALFNGCVYVADYHKVMCPGGRLIAPDRFRAVYGGYSFAMDARNERVSRNAFEAFTESQVLRAPVVDGTCFKPALPYGTIVENEGRKRANIWWPANVRRTKGDPQPFLDHLARVLPVPADQQILLRYMAALVQFVGHKFQWMPLLIGVEGNGKSFFSRCVAASVGQRYTHWPAADKLGKQFNAWLFGKVFFAIEDIAIGDSHDVWEKLKPMITGENIEVEAKGVDQRTDEICGNFMANSNHKNGVRATANDRRVSQLWCGQQSLSDLARDGFSQDYMPRLYDWSRHQDGYAIVAEFLHTYPLGPDDLKWVLGRAPRTSSTDAAVQAGLGRIEQQVLEAVEQDEVGFRGGWISSIFLDRLLERLGRGSTVALNMRRDMLRSLGYDWHPNLPDGRVHNIVLPDGAKPKLFVKHGHAALALTGGGEIARAYAEAQGAATPGR